jgi:hypothetical protein
MAARSGWDSGVRGAKAAGTPGCAAAGTSEAWRGVAVAGVMVWLSSKRLVRGGRMHAMISGWSSNKSSKIALIAE